MKKDFRRPFAQIIICMVLAASLYGIYSQTLGFEFVHYDDDDYIFENTIVQKGLSFENLI